jgi:hypothetical protein
MRAKRPRFQAVCGSRARQGDGRSTAETPALPAGVRLAGETPALPGSVRLAGETGVGESDRRDAHPPRRCAARGRDRGRGERPASRPRPQAVRGTRASHPRSQAVRGTRARQGDGRSTAETPAPPGGARLAGETGGREIDRRDACASSRGAARGRDRGTGDRPPRRLRFQPGCGSRARRPRSQAVQGRAVFQRTRTIPERRQVAPTGMRAIDQDVISGVTRPTVRAAFPLPLRRQRLAQFDASGAPAPRGSAIRPETAQTRQHPHPGRRTASPDRQCP